MALRGARLLAEDCVGGSDEALAQTYLAARELALDVMRTIPSFFNDYEEIHTLACCCRDLQSIVLNKKYWEGKHINLVRSSLANAPQAVSNAATFFQQAATLTMEIGQLACVEDIPRQAIVHWYPEELDIPGNNIRGWASTHPLFGVARFSLTVPRTVTAIYIGAKATANKQKRLLVNCLWDTADHLPGVSIEHGQPVCWLLLAPLMSVCSCGPTVDCSCI